jgi:hypothetical protein
MSIGKRKTDEYRTAKVIFVDLLHHPKRSLKLVSSSKVFKVSNQPYIYREGAMATCLGG